MGLRGAGLTFSDDAPGGTQTVSLSGTGTAAPSADATPSGTYVVTVSGVAGTLTQTAALTLVVQ